MYIVDTATKYLLNDKKQKNQEVTHRFFLLLSPKYTSQIKKVNVKNSLAVSNGEYEFRKSIVFIVLQFNFGKNFTTKKTIAITKTILKKPCILLFDETLTNSHTTIGGKRI